MLVSLGAALTIMTSQYIAAEIGQTDITRLGAQVVSGIGFLGAGTILFTGYRQIKGLTTASATLGVCMSWPGHRAGFIYGA
jgi:putative Mg2+ transporter-C (MgtC) family protein